MTFNLYSRKKFQTFIGAFLSMILMFSYYTVNALPRCPKDKLQKQGISDWVSFNEF